MTDIPANRRDMLQAVEGFAGGSLLGVFGISPALAAKMGKISGRSERPLKAASSNIGLQVSWCAQGKQAAEQGVSFETVESPVESTGLSRSWKRWRGNCQATAPIKTTLAGLTYFQKETAPGGSS